jgi:hypothetical protein
VKTGEIPSEIVGKVPDGLELVYWDYYSVDRDLFAHMLDCHKKFGKPFYFAGGAWKWNGFGAHNAFSLKSTEMQLDVCAECGVDRVIVTSWGDQGGEASQFSVLPSMLYFAERCYYNQVDDIWMKQRAKQCFDVDMETLMAFDLPDSLPEITADKVSSPRNPSKYLLYNDLFERFFDCHMKRDSAPQIFAAHAEKLMNLSKDRHFGYALETLGRLCRILSQKCDLGWRIYDAYCENNKQTLRTIVDIEIPRLLKNIEEFLVAYRYQWYLENKPYGFSTQEIRIGGLMERIRSVNIRLKSYLRGEIERIEELECQPLPIDPSENGEYILFKIWRDMVSAGIL